jgi:hypothetical protein
LSFKRGREQNSQPEGIAMPAVFADTQAGVIRMPLQFYGQFSSI